MDIPNFSALKGEELFVALQQYIIAAEITDVHLSPQKHDVKLEVRNRGILESLAVLTPGQYKDIVRRIKFASKLMLNVSNIPQDGQLSFTIEDREISVRVATIPSKFGEKLTLRFLDPARGLVPLADLGFASDIADKLHKVADAPHGLMLVTGPTGSGKTTTLYALLKSIIGTGKHIITIEDPVEYEIAGIVQSQVDHEHDYHFAAALRSILRHDPDVILVGEIRDYETAQTAIDAALTGHMVLSTLHTNSAIEAIPRLLSMGISPYTFAPALRGVLAQRLVRTVKPNLPADADLADNTNYDGRTIIAEFVDVQDDLRDLILAGEQTTELTAVARKHGYKPMREVGGDLVKQGVTTQMEIDRVTL
jgi:general secretion pathway protein E